MGLGFRASVFMGVYGPLGVFHGCGRADIIVARSPVDWRVLWTFDEQTLTESSSSSSRSRSCGYDRSGKAEVAWDASSCLLLKLTVFLRDCSYGCYSLLLESFRQYYCS